MFDMENIIKNIGGIGYDVQTTKKGKLYAVVKHQDGTDLETLLYRVKYCKGAEDNLCSITVELGKDAKLSNDMKIITH